MDTRRNLPAPRRLLAGAVLCALLLTQALGLLHRVLHAQGPALVSYAVQRAVAPEPRALERLFAQHQDAQDCQVFDQLTQADAPGFALAAMTTEPVAEAPLATGAAPDLAARPAGNLARGPPTPS